MEPKNKIWARVLRVFSGLEFFRSLFLYWLTPTFGWFILVAVLFALLAIAVLVIAKANQTPNPIAWLFLMF